MELHAIMGMSKGERVRWRKPEVFHDEEKARVGLWLRWSMAM